MIPKFRAWHKELKKMISHCSVHFFYEFNDYDVKIQWEKDRCDCDNKLNHAYGNEIELMQSTGLKSKDDIEVFEGDILAYDFVGGVHCFVIERCIDSNQLIAKYLYLGNDWEHLSDTPIGCSVIMGNIYEHPHLLTNDNTP